MNIHRSARTTFPSRGLRGERVHRHGWNVNEAAAAFGISDTTVRKWLARFDELGLAGLRDRTSKPHRQPLKTAPSWEAQIKRSSGKESCKSTQLRANRRIFDDWCARS